MGSRKLFSLSLSAIPTEFRICWVGLNFWFVYVSFRCLLIFWWCKYGFEKPISLYIIKVTIKIIIIIIIIIIMIIIIIIITSSQHSLMYYINATANGRSSDFNKVNHIVFFVYYLATPQFTLGHHGTASLTWCLSLQFFYPKVTGIPVYRSDVVTLGIPAYRRDVLPLENEIQSWS